MYVFLRPQGMEKMAILDGAKVEALIGATLALYDLLRAADGLRL